jgi:hypothetical protein
MVEAAEESLAGGGGPVEIEGSMLAPPVGTVRLSEATR